MIQWYIDLPWYVQVYLSILVYITIVLILSAVMWCYSTILPDQRPKYRVIIGSCTLFWPFTLPLAMLAFVIYLSGYLGEHLYYGWAAFSRSPSDELDEDIEHQNRLDEVNLNLR